MKSIAIIGASTDREKYGNKAVRAYLEAGWTVYPINPHHKEIEGLTCYARLEDIPGDVPIVSLYIPAKISASMIKSFKAKGVKEVFINPGAEGDALIDALEQANIEIIMACSIREVGGNPELL